MKDYYLQKARQLANLSDRFTPTPKNKSIRGIAKKMGFKIFSGPLRRFIEYRKYYDAYEMECKKYNDQNTEKVAKFFCTPFHRGQIWYREDFLSTINMPFEILELPIPVGYKRIMSIFFGED